MKTEWKLVADCPRYEVSNTGKVRNAGNKKEMKLIENARKRCKSKQIRAHLWNGEKKIMRYVSRLVATAFIPNPDCLPFVEHLNGNYADNRACNLRWATRQEVMRNPVVLQRIRRFADSRRKRKK